MRFTQNLNTGLKSSAYNDETLIFIHIAKTAGTTLNYLLERELYNNSVFGAYDNTLDPRSRSGTGVFEAETVFQKLRIEEQARGAPFRFVSGHMRFGLHKHLDRPSMYITFLRDPVERVTSAFNYVRSRGWLPEDSSLLDFVKMDFLGNSNAMVRQLVDDPSLDASTDPALRSDARAVAERDYIQAKKDITQRFLFAAPVNRFDEALIVLAEHYDWPLEKLYYVSENITPKRGPKADITSEVVSLIIDRNRWDKELYDWAKKRFARKIKDITKDPGALAKFHEGVRAYQQREGYLKLKADLNEEKKIIMKALHEEKQKIRKTLREERRKIQSSIQEQQKIIEEIKQQRSYRAKAALLSLWSQLKPRRRPPS